MVPLTSDLNETPSSSGPLAPLSIAAGTVVLGQIVCCPATFAEQAKTTARPNSIAPTYLRNLVLDVLVSMSPPTTQLGCSAIFIYPPLGLHTDATARSNRVNFS